MNCITIERPSLVLEPLRDSCTAFTNPACSSVLMALWLCFLVSDSPSIMPAAVDVVVGRPPTV